VQKTILYLVCRDDRNGRSEFVEFHVRYPSFTLQFDGAYVLYCLCVFLSSITGCREH